MLKRSIQLNGDIDLFVTEFTTRIQSLFDNVTTEIDTSNQTKITVLNTTTNEVLLYFFVIQSTYNNRNILLLKTYGLNIYPSDVIREDSDDWGPMVVYKSTNDLIYGKAGFLTTPNTQSFIIDELTYCLNEDNNTVYFIGLSCNDCVGPMFIITPTNLNNLGILGITTMANNDIGIRTVTYNNKTTQEHNLNILQIKNSNITSMTKYFLPESINAEYFPYVYLINGVEDSTLDIIKYNNHMYIPCFNNCMALIIY